MSLVTTAELERIAEELGIDVVGAAPAEAYRVTERHIADRRERGLFADMRFTMARPEVSCHPETLLPNARTVVSAALCYYTPEPPLEAGRGRLPRYTWFHAYAELPGHVPGFIAERIGITLELELECLAALARAGQIYKRRGKWRVRRVLTVDTRDDPEGNLRLKRHWSEVALGRIGSRALEAGSLFSYNLFAISEEALGRIRALHMNYFERLRAIVDECEDPTQVVLVNVQLCPLGATRAP